MAQVRRGTTRGEWIAIGITIFVVLAIPAGYFICAALDKNPQLADEMI